MVCMSFAQTLKINGIQAITSNGAVQSIFRETLRNFRKLSFMSLTIIRIVKCHLNFGALRNSNKTSDLFRPLQLSTGKRQNSNDTSLYANNCARLKLSFQDFIKVS